MYILVQHSISQADPFFAAAASAQLPPNLQLHQSFPSPDRSHCVCIWEAQSGEALRNFLEPAFGDFCRNEYFEVINRAGIAMPPQPIPMVAG